MTEPDPSPPSVDILGLAARNHPLRAALAREMHIRKLPRFATPCRLLQIVTLLGDGGDHASFAHVAGLCVASGSTLTADAKYVQLQVAGLDLVWERHTEFATYTFVLPGTFQQPFDPAAFLAIHPVLDGIPGQIIRATQIAILGPGAPPPEASLIAASFDSDWLVACDVAGGKARIWSDFQLNPDGFGRLLIADQGLPGDEAAQLVQRIQELGNYRNMALLGLPEAQRLTPDVTRLEKRLAALTFDVSERKSQDDTLLAELTFLSAELARLLAETRYRMSATRAYAQISADRLASIEVRAIGGYQTLADFTERRLTPAVRTCDSFSQRLEDLSQRAAWTSSLLRTRIDTALARQNRDLLASMDGRTRLQLRLQQAVEGLSVVAISYYLVALVGYVLRATSLPYEIAQATSVPVVLLAVTVLMLTLKRRLRD